MDFTIYSVINEFFNIENHIEIWTYILPFVTWPTFKSITFYNVFRFILRFLKRVMLKIQKIIIWWFLPYISVLFISQKEKKLKKESLIAIVDIVCFLILFLFAFNNTQSLAHLPKSHYENFVWSETFLLVLRTLGLICSLLYSFCFNFRLLKKYLVVLKIQKYEKVLFLTSVILFSLCAYFFLFLYLTYKFLDINLLGV